MSDISENKDSAVAETTPLAIGLGLVLALVLGAANVYLGLYAGMTVSASIPAAVVSMAILRGVFRRGTILENNIAQTIASTGESLAAGAIFTIPALVLVGVWKDFQFWPTTLIIMCGGLLGVVFMVPLRRALIVDREDLTYPEGVACSEVLTVGQEGGSGIKPIGIGLLVGAAFKFLVSGLSAIKGTLEFAVAKGQSIFYGGSDLSVALVSVGYIVKLKVAVQIFLGGVIGWVIAIPLIGGYESGEALESAWSAWSTQVRYIGVGTMLVGGLFSIWSVRKGIFAGLGSLHSVPETKKGKAVPRTEQDMPLYILVAVLLLTILLTMGLYQYLIGSIGAMFASIIMTVIASFLFVAVATYIVGLVGSSNSPVSGMTICALLMTAGMLLALGIKGDSAILATLGVAGVVCCAACTAGDIAQDLKTGQLVGSTPRKQQMVEVIGVVIPAFIFAPVMALLHNTYGIGDGLLAPQAALFASLAEGFFGEGTLPWNMIKIGAGIGITLIIIDFFLERAKSPFRTHIMPVAVGIYLPMSLSMPIFIGGLIYFTLHRKQSNGDITNDASDHGVLYGSGLIAGEALMGIGLAGLMTVLAKYGKEMWELEWHWGISAVIFGAFLMSYLFMARKPS